MPAPDNITTLGSTASFYDWFQSYNNNAVGKLNKMYVYNIYAGNGIGVTTDGQGGYTLSLTSVVSTGVTFSGDVIFSGNASFSSNIQIPNISQGFNGNFSSSGVTLGRVVRVNSTGGLSLADASGRTSAEAIGVVTAFSTTSSTVSLVGKISGTTLTSEILEGGGVFSTGCVYFLSPNIPGKVTTVEPTLNGKVSKPILIATKSDEAIVLPFRGQYIDLVGICGASGSFNNIIVPIKSLGESEANYKLKPGSIMAFSASAITGVTLYQSSTSPSLYYYKARNNDATNSLLGIVNNYAAAPYSSTVDVVNYMDVRPFASVVEFDDLGWDSTLKNAGFIYLDSDGNPTLTANIYGPIGIASGENFLFYPLISQGQNKGPGPDTSGTYSLVSTQPKNQLINGSLEIWQRVAVGEVSGYTTSATGGYFADRWCFINNYPGGQTLGIRRYSFSENQTDVAGYPSYYFNIQGTTKAANKTFFIENRKQDARNHANKQMTLSFYARNNTGTGVTFTPYIRQYGSTYTSENLNDFTNIFISSASWQRYYSNILVPYPTGNTFSAESFLGVGIKAASSNFNVDFAQFMFEEGLTATKPDLIDADEEYKKCSFYYQRSYPRKTITGAHTVSINNTASDVGFLTNAQGFIGGGAVTGIVTSQPPIFVHTLPVKMRRSNIFVERPEFYINNGVELPANLIELPNVRIFTPYTVDSNLNPISSESTVYNYTANSVLSGTQGTNSLILVTLASYVGGNPLAALGVVRNYQSNVTNLKAGLVGNSDGSVSSVGIKLQQGYLMFDTIAFHYVIDLDMYQGLT